MAVINKLLSIIIPANKDPESLLCVIYIQWSLYSIYSYSSCNKSSYYNPLVIKNLVAGSLVPQWKSLNDTERLLMSIISLLILLCSGKF